MHFTVCFESAEANSLAYGLVFVPSPVWTKGNVDLINLNPQNPHYELGSVGKLLEAEPILSNLGDHDKRAIVVIHEAGHGTATHLSDLVKDLVNEGFAVSQARFGNT